MKRFREYLALIFVWISWAIIMLLAVPLLQDRFDMGGPDTSMTWTADWTKPGQAQASPYLEPEVLDGHVAWDSEYYLSIAAGGYSDPASRAIPVYFGWHKPRIALQSMQPDWISLNHAFFPGYPFAMRAVMTPFLLLGMPAREAGALAGVAVSMLGTLLAMVALYRMGRGLYGRSTGFRAAMYLLIMPGSMFLAMVYTEGFFLGLAFMSLMFARENRFLPAGLFGFAATLTKAAGGLLLIPLLLYWWGEDGNVRLGYGLRKKDAFNLACCLGPVLAYAIFLATLSEKFHFVEEEYYSRQLLALGATLSSWIVAFRRMVENPQTLAYYSVELFALVSGVLSLWAIWKKDRVLAIYGVLSLGFSLTSGVAQGLHRYVLALPSLFLVPAWWGRRPEVDRIWILVNVPLWFMMLLSFVHNQWAG